MKLFGIGRDALPRVRGMRRDFPERARSLKANAQERVSSFRLVAVATVLTGVIATSGNAQEVEAVEPNRGGTPSYEARDPKVALEHLHPAKGYEVSLFASEQDFPLGNPVALNFDAEGRLWVATMPTYPQRLPDEEPHDKIIILEDTDKDGRADKHTVFIDGLHLPTGFELGDGGVYIAAQPNLIFAKDTDGDDRADERHIILHGFGTEDSHHSISAFTWGPDGGLYFQEGTFHHSQVETPYGPVRLVDSGLFRYKPLQYWLEVFVSYRFANPWGHVFDRWGQNFVADASGGSNYVGLPITVNKIYPDKLRGMKVFTSVVRPTSGCEIVSSRHFPDEAQGNFLVNNTIGFQGIKQHRVIEEGSGFTSEEVEPLLYSTDINFRPVDLEFGPDGALYLVDWFNPLIGHMQYSLRDARRDHGHGRIWRVTYKHKPLLDPPNIAGASVPQLLDLLKAYENRTRYRTRIELRSRNHEEVTAALETWIENLDVDDPEFEHHLLEALWVYQTINRPAPELLARVLKSSEPRARAAATRVVRFWRHQIENPVAVLERMARDENPRVRLEAVVALSYITTPESARAALALLESPTDYYLDYALNETIDTLQPWWQPELAKNEFNVSDDVLDYVLARVPTEELTQFARNQAVNVELLTRHGVEQAYREDALNDLAESSGETQTTVLLEYLTRADRGEVDRASEVASDLGRLLTTRDARELAAHDGPLLQLARDGRQASVREAAYAALMAADGDAERAWKAATESTPALVDWLHALPRLHDAALRDGQHARVLPLLKQLPDALQADPAPVQARYVRVDLPGDDRVLTLAEVEVISNGENIAREGSAKQSSTQHGGDAKRAIDGNRHASFEKNGQTHTDEEDAPWWELDLGDTAPIDRIVVWNRREDLGRRLDNYTLTLLDAKRRPVYQQTGLPAPDGSATIEIEADPAAAVQQAAVEALASMNAAPEESATALAELVVRGQVVEPAVEALNAVGAEHIPAEKVGEMAPRIVSYLEHVPLNRLATEPVQEVFTLGAALARALPEDAATPLSLALRNLGVTVVEIRPVPHKMLYDIKSFTVPAGRPVEIRFENIDIMPHNVVITAPGKMATVGMAAEAMAMDEDAQERQYIPDVEGILFFTRLLFPGENERLTFLAPEKPGDYPFVCTYPGHWILMNGTMRVVEEVDEAAMVAERQTEGITRTADTLEARKFVRDWTFDELVRGLDSAKAGRSFANGKAMFDVAGCVECHFVNGPGPFVGPDLGKIHEKYTGADLLRQIVEPSEVVEEDYVTYLVETKDFNSYVGYLVKETDDAVVLRTDPTNPDADVTIPRSEIDTIEDTPLSPMPTGLLTTLQRDEIYDLLMYVESGGNPEHAAFKSALPGAHSGH